jgi:signal transduction histidine kinase
MEEKPIQVLLVEDDADDAMLLREMLAETERFEFEVRNVKRLDEALRVARAERFGVVLLDLSLPDSSGLDTFRDLHRELPELPVVVLTGLDDETVAVAAVHGGAQDYLVKGQANGSVLARSIRYAIERQRTSHYRALLTERERFDTAVSQMSDGIIVTETDWRIATANRAACRLLDVAVDDWRGKSLDEVLLPFALSMPLEEIRASSERFTAFEIARTETHPPLYIDARLSRINDADGDLVSTVLMLRDVTDEHLARHVKATFMTTASHKLRTPLAVLSGYLQVCGILSPQRLAAEWPTISDAWTSAVQQLTDIVDKLLDFEAAGAAQASAAWQPTDVAAAIATVTDRVSARYPAKRIEVTSEVAADATRADCTSEHLEFILEQLLGNAAKFGDKEPVEVDVEVVREDDAWLRFTVADHGPGIPHEYLDRIFDGFVQVEEWVTGQIPGMGIGLRMAQQLVETCGGTISVSSRMGAGSAFTFTLAAVQPGGPGGVGQACRLSTTRG